jgi:IMP dehydrogenase
MVLYKIKARDLDKIPFALGYADVRLISSKQAQILPNEIDLTTNLTKNITMKIPFISAAMDTVTESEMAIKMALMGGIGVIHKNLSPEKQAEEIAKVKRFRSGVITNPITVSPEFPIEEVIRIKKTLGFKSIPVTEDGKPTGKLIGAISDNDYSEKKHANLKVRDRMSPLEKLLVASHMISLEEAEDLLLENKMRKLLLVDENGYLRGMVTKTDIEKGEEYPNATLDKFERLRVGAAIGGPGQDLEVRVPKIVEAGVDVIFIDTSQGFSAGVERTIDYIKRNYDFVDIVAGNIDNSEAVKFLIEKEVHAIKVGIGPGTICTTTDVTGAGVPQLTAVYDCVRIGEKFEMPVIADGGIVSPGQLVFPLAVGASSIMSGKLFAGTDECPGAIKEIVDRKGVGHSVKEYRGMGSLEAMLKGSKSRYFQEGMKLEDLVVQGKEVVVPYIGPVAKQIRKLVNDLKFSLAIHCGVRALRDLRNGDAEFAILPRPAYSKEDLFLFERKE